MILCMWMSFCMYELVYMCISICMAVYEFVYV